MKNMKEFYEEYWKYRQRINKIHTNEGNWVPPRVYKAIELIDLKDNLEIIDIGCGEGTIGKLVKEKNNKIRFIGVDISQEAIQLAKNYYDQTYLINLDKDDFQKEWKNTYDYAICIEVLEHLFNPEKTLLQIKTLLKKNGILITSFPNMAWWKYRLKMLKGVYPVESRAYNMIEHLQNYTLDSFTKLLNECGYEIKKLNPDYNKIPTIIKHVPKLIRNKILIKHPNLFGYQIVLSAEIIH